MIRLFALLWMSLFSSNFPHVGVQCAWPPTKGELMTHSHRALLNLLGLLAVGAIALTAVPVRAVEAAGDSGQTVEQLAEDGYWGENDTWPKHKAMLGKPAPALELSQWYDESLT